MAGRARRGSAPDRRERGDRVRAARPDGRRRSAGARVRARLCAPFPGDIEGDLARQARALSRPLRRRHGEGRAHAARVRQRGDGAGTWLPRYRRLLDAVEPQAAPRRNPGAHPPRQRARRSLPSGKRAAYGTRGILRGQARIPVAGRPRRLRERSLPRQHRMASTPHPPLLRAPRMTPIAPEIFKAYDIRGIVDRTLTEAAAEAIGQALGTMARAKGVQRFIVGRDGRLSGPRLARAVSRGLNAAGMDVIDIGVVATPIGYFATHHLSTRSGVMVTGSHNPPEYNGLKMMVAGDTLSGETIQDLRRIIQGGKYTAPAKPGSRSTADITEPYLDRIAGDVKLARKMTIAVDCGNGSPCAIAPQ